MMRTMTIRRRAKTTASAAARPTLLTPMVLTVAVAELRSPALIVVGEVVRLQELLASGEAETPYAIPTGQSGASPELLSVFSLLAKAG